MAYGGTDRRLFFDIYVEEGGNIDAVWKRVKEDYPGISKSTLHRIKDRDGWDDRMSKVEAVHQQYHELRLTLRETLLSDLLEKREKFSQALEDKEEDFKPQSYAQFINALTRIDDQIIALLNMIIDEERRSDTPQVDKAALFLEFLQSLTDYMSDYPEAMDVLNKHFDGFVTHFKEQHA